MNESDQKAKAEARLLTGSSLTLVFLLITSFAQSGERESPLMVFFTFGLPIAATICVIVLGARVTGRIAPGAPGRGKPLFFMVLGIIAGLGALFLRLTAESRPEQRRASHDESAGSPAAAVFPLVAQQTKTDQKPLKEVKAKAEAGDPDSEVELGLRYQDGEGVTKDLVEAVKWYRKAAEQKYARGQNALGLSYYEGEGVAKDQVEAATWYRKAAEQGYAKAEYNLGIAHYTGEGVEKDYVEAATWLRKAAEQNYGAAQYSLGVCYAKGEGVVKDQVEAVKWYRKAAEQNYAAAQGNLGICFYKGEGVAKDHGEAAKWLRKAADQNLAVAQYNLGFCYAEGEGVVKDPVEAGAVVSQGRRAK
jgi:TPR repeat protein